MAHLSEMQLFIEAEAGTYSQAWQMQPLERGIRVAHFETPGHLSKC